MVTVAIGLLGSRPINLPTAFPSSFPLSLKNVEVDMLHCPLSRTMSLSRLCASLGHIANSLLDLMMLMNSLSVEDVKVFFLFFFFNFCSLGLLVNIFTVM